MQAGELVGRLYDALLKRYKDPTSPSSLQSLNALCVRLVFRLYAEDAGVFGKRNMFRDWLRSVAAGDVRRAPIDLFAVLDQKPEERDPYLDDRLAAFPYVNGGLFKARDVEIPRFTDEIVELLLTDASANFDWSEISPTIFGAVFESTLNPETRRKGGMHYTSIENIRKVIDPLFLDDLRDELAAIQKLKTPKIRDARLFAFQRKPADLTFFDPACGSGNFLTETYLSLRRLENAALKTIYDGGSFFEAKDVVKVSIGQFFGIEINDFAVTVAKTALWIAESQMLRETEKLLSVDLDFLPLRSYASVVEGNALRLDWEAVVPKTRTNFIMGNPPFVGTKYQTEEQKKDVSFVDPRLKPLDYVTCWYKKASDFIQNTDIRCAFVSTNSITQGEQVAPLWSTLNVQIDFAYRTFRWDSESNSKARVHCVIIGFSHRGTETKRIFDNGVCADARHINGYLLDAPDVFFEARRKPLCPTAPTMRKGSQPTDGGHLLLTKEERKALIDAYPQTENFIRQYMGAEDLINNKVRYCLWLKDCPPHILKSTPPIMKRLAAVKNSRLESNKESTRKWADRPFLFTEDRQPKNNYLIVPVVSSESRRYVPIAYVSCDVVANTNAQMVPNADLYVFGVLTSGVHNAWMRVVCGRLEMRYAYSATIVYNNFPWPEPTDAQRAEIERTARAILDARANYPDSSLADLYDDLLTPPDLRKARRENDAAVERAYGFAPGTPESNVVAELIDRYRALTAD